MTVTSKHNGAAKNGSHVKWENFNLKLLLHETSPPSGSSFKPLFDRWSCRRLVKPRNASGEMSLMVQPMRPPNFSSGRFHIAAAEQLSKRYVFKPLDSIEEHLHGEHGSGCTCLRSSQSVRKRPSAYATANIIRVKRCPTDLLRGRNCKSWGQLICSKDRQTQQTCATLK